MCIRVGVRIAVISRRFWHWLADVVRKKNAGRTLHYRGPNASRRLGTPFMITRGPNVTREGREEKVSPNPSIHMARAHVRCNMKTGSSKVKERAILLMPTALPRS